jgi:plastocyanin
MKAIRTFCILSAAILVVAFAAPVVEKTIFGSPGASQVEIKIDNFSFSPATITVAAGTIVRWVNHDDIPHNVVSEDKAFKSKVMDTDEDFTYTFAKPGTYAYFCSIHPRMTGKIIVQ